ncbi:MAG: carboxypeptidase-like regulatory domain-containing protein, partial [Planctomycetota bacterium]
MHARRVVGAGLVLVSLFCLGCGDSGPERGYVEGTVTMDGEPLPDAVVTFQPEDTGRPSYGKTDENGHYELQYTSDKKGALVGMHRVTISTFERGGGGGAEGYGSE